MNQLGRSTIFISLVLLSGYWQYHIAEADIPKMAFLTKYRLYKWVVMPMGLTNAPATFTQTMNNLFVYLLDKRVVVFLYNILIYSMMVEEHFKLLENVFYMLI